MHVLQRIRPAAVGAALALAVGVITSTGTSAIAASSTADEGTVHLVASLLGRNEIPGADGAVGDLDGRAVEVITIKGSTLTYTVRWQGIDVPTAAHIHAGVAGANGDVKVPLFASGQFGYVARGSVTVGDGDLLAALTADPTSFSTDLHTNGFPGGAVRGQLHKVSQPVGEDGPKVDVAPVIRGKQIYACTSQDNGAFAFTQHDVSALLNGDIKHSFVEPKAGPPQWVAPDGSAVTGTLLLRTPNGTGNIAELELRATQTGGDQGRLAQAVEVMRLNTVGGVAPGGPCDPKATPIAKVPYQADYLFIR
ncbi:CHRD domain-containing protein [Nonomuraea sp. NPDC003727]